MRVIAGKAKGRRLRAVAGTTRPTGSRVKEALFSMLGDRIRDARVLDLYAGSGALGIEALSRGAASATFVDRDPAAIATIRANLDSADLAGRARVVRADAAVFVEGEADGPFDLALVDPPYAAGLASAPLAELTERGLLAPGGVIVMETSSRVLPLVAPPGLRVVAERRYGDSALVLIEAGDTAGRGG
ncbi:MAG: 16S rRNA (guanine(966)-N(2))-methyltransferase RsmD [Actinomycetota bacterium]